MNPRNSTSGREKNAKPQTMDNNSANNRNILGSTPVNSPSGLRRRHSLRGYYSQMQYPNPIPRPTRTSKQGSDCQLILSAVIPTQQFHSCTTSHTTPLPSHHNHTRP